MYNSCPHYQQVAECSACQNTCEQCGFSPAYPARLKLNLLPWQEESVGTCHECGESPIPIDSTGTCRSCNNNFSKMGAKRVTKLCQSCLRKNALYCSKCNKECDVYAEGTAQCPDCFYGEEFREETTRVKVCESCNQVSHLNIDGECANCYKERRLRESQSPDAANLRICPNCRKATLKSRKLCKSCERKAKGIKSCRGCGTYFTPTRSRESFCTPCGENILRGNCTSCLNPISEGGSNDRGWCESCEKDNK